MDVLVTKVPEQNEWQLTDLLGRDMGTIKELSPGVFRIQPAGNAIKTLADIQPRSYGSVDSALAAIELHTRGVCRHVREAT